MLLIKRKFNEFIRLVKIFQISLSIKKICFIRFLGLFPLFSTQTIFSKTKFINKINNIKNKKFIGYAFEDRFIILYFLLIKLYKYKVKEGIDATVDQFYLIRSIDDFKYLLKKTKKYVRIKENDLLFDPGCGTGKYLYYACDKFNCRGIGVDIYPPAIEIAQRLVLSTTRINFFNHSTLDDDFLKKILRKNCDFILLNSWINHVKDYPNFKKCVEILLNRCRYIFVINNKKYDVKRLLNSPKIVFSEINGETYYGLIKGKL